MPKSALPKISNQHSRYHDELEQYVNFDIEPRTEPTVDHVVSANIDLEGEAHHMTDGLESKDD